MKKTLPSLRVNEKTRTKVERAVDKINETLPIELTTQEFRRIALEFLSQHILSGGELPKIKR